MYFDFFDLRIQFDRVLDFESNGGIFDSLEPFGGELWRFENLNKMNLNKIENIRTFGANLWVKHINLFE